MVNSQGIPILGVNKVVIINQALPFTTFSLASHVFFNFLVGVISDQQNKKPYKMSIIHFIQIRDCSFGPCHIKHPDFGL